MKPTAFFCVVIKLFPFASLSSIGTPEKVSLYILMFDVIPIHVVQQKTQWI